QRPVADLCKQGVAVSVPRNWVNRTSAIFLQLDEMCQGVVRLWKKKNTKKLRRRRKTPAQIRRGVDLRALVRAEFASVVVRLAQQSREFERLWLICCWTLICRELQPVSSRAASAHASPCSSVQVWQV